MECLVEMTLEPSAQGKGTRMFWESVPEEPSGTRSGSPQGTIRAFITVLTELS